MNYIGVFGSVSTEYIGDSQEASFFLSRSSHRWYCLVDAVRKPAKRKRLEPHFAGARQVGEEETLAAEQSRPDLPDILNIIIHAGLQRYQASGIYTQRLSWRKVKTLNGASRVYEAETIPLEFLHDESFSAEQSDADSSLESNPN